MVKATAAREPSLRVATQIMVTATTAPTAVSLIAHCGMSSGETSARLECQRMRLMYSAKIRLITALEPVALLQKGAVLNIVDRYYTRL